MAIAINAIKGPGTLVIFNNDPPTGEVCFPHGEVFNVRKGAGASTWRTVNSNACRRR